MKATDEIIISTRWWHRVYKQKDSHVHEEEGDGDDNDTGLRQSYLNRGAEGEEEEESNLGCIGFNFWKEKWES